MIKFAAFAVFAVVPGLVVFLLLALIGLDQYLAGIIGGCITGLGVDIILNGTNQ